jgi:secreted Zn-dependent insulinase-like peptidase
LSFISCKGKESLNELELYAVEMFSEIENKKISKQKFPNDPYRRDLPALILYAVAVQDIRQMNISWVIPDYRDSYQSNPSKYITYLSKRSLFIAKITDS